VRPSLEHATSDQSDRVTVEATTARRITADRTIGEGSGPRWARRASARATPCSSRPTAGRVPAGAVQAANGFGDAKYGGPCPPDGQHKYLLTLYALGARSNLADGVAGATAIDQLQAGALASALVTGSFG